MKRLLLCICVFFGVAFSHQVVAKPIGKNKYEIAFWTHDGFEKYKSENLLGVEAYDEDLKKIKAGIDYQNLSVLTEKTPAMMLATFDAGYWVDTHKGFVKGDKLSAKGIIFGSIHSIKISKTIFNWKDSMINPIGGAYELTPLLNPIKLKVGDVLPVLVTKYGEPVGNVEIEVANHDELSVKTNSQGIVLIPITKKGLQIIAGRFEQKIFNDKKADIMFIQSSLSFEVK